MKRKGVWLYFAFFIIFWPIIGFAQKDSILDGLNSKIGVVYWGSKDNLKFKIPNKNLKKDTKVVIITLSPQRLICCAEVVGISSSEDQAIQRVFFDNGKSVMYDLKLVSGHNFQLGFGIIDSTLEFTEKSGKVIGDLNKDGVPESFRDCTSMEGVHLTIWSGEPLKGTKLRHAYFYLGYDVEPSCLEKDFKQ